MPGRFGWEGDLLLHPKTFLNCSDIRLHLSEVHSIPRLNVISHANLLPFSLVTFYSFHQLFACKVLDISLITLLLVGSLILRSWKSLVWSSSDSTL